MADLTQQFNEAAEKVKALKKKPSEDELLQLYGLFKQATFCDVDTARPGLLDVRGKAKWDAWNCRKGMTQDCAKEEYVKFVAGLVEKHGI